MMKILISLIIVSVSSLLGVFFLKTPDNISVENPTTEISSSLPSIQSPDWVKNLEEKEVEWNFTIINSRKNLESMKIYINSHMDYKHKDCKTVVIDLRAVPEMVNVSPVMLKGKTVKARGIVTERGILIKDLNKLLISQ